MNKLFWNILRENKTDYIQTVIGCSWIVSLIYSSTAAGEYLFYISTGIIPQLLELLLDMRKEFLIPYGLLLILLVLVLSGYVRKRAAIYVTLTSFGMKRKHKYKFIMFEYMGIVSCSVIFGIFLGVFEAEFVKVILERVLGNVTEHIQWGYAPLKLTLLLVFVIFGVGFMICDEIIACMGVDYIIRNESEKRQKIRMSTAMCIVSMAMLGVTIISVMTYWGKCGSIMPEFLGIITILFFMYFYGAYFIKCFERSNRYYRKIYWLDDWCSNFYSHMNITYIVGAFLFIIIFTFMLQIIDNLPVVQKENYPYDLVWGANEEDKEFLRELKEQHKVEMNCIPSIRVTSGDYGEHMGISESEYERLTGEKLKLLDDEIYVVYQRDKSEYGMLELDYGKKKPRLYIGSAEADIWIHALKIMPGNQFVRDYEIVGEKNKIVTGNFKSRQFDGSGIKGTVFETVIIFSDAEYQKISKTARGSDLTVVMNIPNDYKQVIDRIYKYAEANSQVNFFDYKDGNLLYEKKDLIREEQKSKMLKVCAMVMNIITLIFCIIYVLYSDAARYRKQMKWKYAFYFRLGMSECKFKKCIYREVLFTTKMAFICSVPFAFLLTVIKILYKNLPVYWTIWYLIASIGFIAVLNCVVYFTVSVIERSNFKQIKRGIQNE